MALGVEDCSDITSIPASEVCTKRYLVNTSYTGRVLPHLDNSYTTLRIRI